MRTEGLAELRLLLVSSRKSAFMTAFGLLVSILVAGCGVIPGLRPASEPGAGSSSERGSGLVRAK